MIARPSPRGWLALPLALGVSWAPAAWATPPSTPTSTGEPGASPEPTDPALEDEAPAASPGDGDDDLRDGETAPGPVDAVDTAASDDDADDAPVGAAPAELLDATLPCGLRVLVARDASLPVAGVVLAIETGTADDPDGLDGLVHALGYQLQQGNRWLRPDAIIDEVHAMGGLATMAVGTHQVRYESLIPAAGLERLLSLELQRLRAPTVNEPRWRQSVGRARADKRSGGAVPGKALAAVWDEPGLEHDGRRPASTLLELEPLAVSRHLAERFDYSRATLTVVSDAPPEEVLAAVEALAADLPARPRQAPTAHDPPPPSRNGLTEPASPADASSDAPTPDDTDDAPSTAAPAPSGPRALPVKGAKGDTFVWALPGTAEAIFTARVLCGVLNRQSPSDGDPPKLAVRCVMHEDPRRPAMSVRLHNTDDPQGVLRRRLAALREGRGDVPELMARQRERQSSAIARVSSSALGLARLLAFGPPRGPGQGVTPRQVRTLTGAASLSDPNVVARVLPDLLTLERATVLTALNPKGTIEPSREARKPARPAEALDEDEPDPDAADAIEEDRH